MKKKVFVGLSGGVDSSVAAYLLKQATPNNFSKLFGRPTPKGFRGYDVYGVHLRCWNRGGCDVVEAEYARRTAEHLDIPFYIFDLEKEYKRAVVDYMVKGYKQGITPNPDVMCNKEIKFGLFLKKALEFGADYVATGHYVRLKRLPDAFAQGVSGATPKSYPSQKHRASLHIARDKTKDQSYFLWTLTQEQLKHSLFPIGGYLKSEVRKIAKKAGLPSADKKDSQGICFLGQVTLRDFLGEYLPKKKGNITDVFGQVLGKHDGIQFYTIGQRHGLKIASDLPYYVADKDVKTNTLVVAKGSDNPSLYQKEIILTNINFINTLAPSLIRANRRIRILCRVRYRQLLFSASLSVVGASRLRITFDRSQKFIAPGQSAVFYDKSGEMLGGGVIV